MPSFTPFKSARGRRRENAGYSLFELITALFVFTVGIGGTFTLYHAAIAKTKAVQETALAVRALENELERVAALPDDALKVGDSRPFSEAAELAQLHLVQTRIEINAADTPGLVEVHASVIWRSEHGRLREVSATTLRAVSP